MVVCCIAGTYSLAFWPKMNSYREFQSFCNVFHFGSLYLKELRSEVFVNCIMGLVLKGDGTVFIALQFWELCDALVTKGCACQWPLDTVERLFYLNLICFILHF